MEADTAIVVENLGKRYRLGELNHHRSLRQQLGRWLKAPWRRAAAAAETGDNVLWALRDVSFTIRCGEVVGIVGRNGAGKSTLLKILTRITRPSTGQAMIRGRVGSLLEVGTGFHPELTGRENIFLNGAILGMDHREIRQKFDEIVAFAGVGDFLDTPVKRYSSGMGVRLAFAVAAHLDPELLIVDEVLSVGDAEFQRKCLDKIDEVARDGRTVLFVTHNMQTVSSLCSRALLIDHGRLTMDGPAADVVRNYLGRKTDLELDRRWDDPATAPGNEHIRLHRVRVARDDGGDPREIELGTPFRVECWFWNLRPHTRLNLSLYLKTDDDLGVLVSTTMREPHWYGREFPAGLFRAACHIPGRLLNNGAYRVAMYFVKDNVEPLYVDVDLARFEVHEFHREMPWKGKWNGVVRPELTWTTELTAEQVAPADAAEAREARCAA